MKRDAARALRQAAVEEALEHVSAAVLVLKESGIYSGGLSEEEDNLRFILSSMKGEMRLYKGHFMIAIYEPGTKQLAGIFDNPQEMSKSLGRNLAPKASICLKKGGTATIRLGGNSFEMQLVEMA